MTPTSWIISPMEAGGIEPYAYPFNKPKTAFFTLFFLTQFLLLGANRLLWLGLSRSLRQAGYNRRNVFLYGTRAEYQLLKQWTNQNKDFGYHLDGWFHLQSSTDSLDLTTEFDSMAGDGSVDHFLCDPTQLHPDQLETAVDWAEDKGARIHLIEPRTEFITSRLSSRDRFGPFAAVRLRREPLADPTHRTLKRVFDVIFSTLVLTFFYWWFYCLAGLLIKLSSRGPVIIRQNRIGIDGMEFRCLKFRTMVSDRSAEKGYAHLTKKEDHRITYIGKLLRKSNLDELPQFVNVFKGYMSVVGPRPHMVSEDHEIADKIKKYRIRRFVKPGITGWAAINGYRGGTENMALMQKRIDYDLDYIENWNFWLDIKICWKTFWQMITLDTGAH
ncbi:MAG: exopolysaccharide biosynthesis polyprenyl glycosylphosphotransferase [Candidatus Marinimicrobia bacterium]|nr:exopolysaccharide biosynthesis polyprenyl glycosylphosphotransferase [Candidatus Neomarinimicrobiota bacterium]